MKISEFLILPGGIISNMETQKQLSFTTIKLSMTRQRVNRDLSLQSRCILDLTIRKMECARHLPPFCAFWVSGKVVIKMSLVQRNEEEKLENASLIQAHFSLITGQSVAAAYRHHGHMQCDI